MPLVRDLVYGAVVGSGWPRSRIRRANGAAIFCFHNVVAGPGVPAGDRSLHVELAEFEVYLEWMTRIFTVVPLSEIVTRIEHGRTIRGLAALTFDDAYRGVFAHAIPALRSRGLPATVFVVSGASESPSHFWWDLLGGSGGLDSQTRDRCLNQLRGDRAAILATYPDREPTALNPEFLPAGWREVGEAIGADIAIGSHSVTHRNLTALTDAELDYELAASQVELEARLGVRPETISYPYGLHDDRVRRAARQMGYRGGVVLAAGLADPRHGRWRLSRINVPAGITLDALECRTAGLRWRRT